MRSILKKKKLSDEDKKVINQFVKNNGFKYAENVMLDYKNKALKILETFEYGKNSLKSYWLYH